jgi:hypothetical protein
VSHDRPDLADLKASLELVRSILGGGNHETNHAAAMTPGACPACVAVAATAWVINFCAALTGSKTVVPPGLARAMLAAVEATERDLEAGSN